MTKEEYAEYEAAYEHGVDGLSAISSGACSSCRGCCDNYDYNDETEEFQITLDPWFSKSACEVCGSRLGGNRSPLHGVDGYQDIIHLDVCDDCVYYTAYGRLDDLTMEGIG